MFPDETQFFDPSPAAQNSPAGPPSGPGPMYEPEPPPGGQQAQMPPQGPPQAPQWAPYNSTAAIPPVDNYAPIPYGVSAAPPGHDYYRILRSKLHWGRGGIGKTDVSQLDTAWNGRADGGA